MRTVLPAASLAIVLALGGCSPAQRQTPAVPSVTEATVSVSGTSAIAALSASSAPASTGTAAKTVEDGVHDCYVRSIDRRGPGRLVLVFVRVFTGAEAEQAAQQADEQLPPGTHSYVRVDDPTEHKLPLATGVKAPAPPFDGVYRVTVTAGRITAIAPEKLP